MGLGEVITKNILIYEPSCEKMGIIKHANNIDYWVVTHDRYNNHFFSHLLTTNGISSNPIISIAGDAVLDDPLTANSSTQGYMKISNDGTKLAYVSLGNQKLQLFDFSIQTRVISSPLTLLSGFSQMYGVEFSPNSKILYHSNINNGLLYQFNLEATDIIASMVTFNYGNTNIVGALQLGPDKKIYLVNYLSNKLSVINNPNIVGSGCDFQFNSITLDTQYNHIGTLGLPTFNQAFFFVPAIQLDNACVGQTTNFNFNTNQTVLNAIWNFGDGTTSNALSPNHTYSLPGTYEVTVNVNTSNGSGTNTRNITIYPKPNLLNSTISLKQCDDDNDGFTDFNLNESIPFLVANATGLIIRFYENSIDAENQDNNITNLISYTNQTVSNDIIYVRVENSNGCFTTAQLNLQVSTTMIPPTFQLVYSECDDLASGSNMDGIVSNFNFSNATAQIQALFPINQLLNITYYQNLVDALAEQNPILNTSSFANIDYPNIQNIYVRMDSQINNECLGLGHHITLNVERIPIVQYQIIRHCDDDQDGMYNFDISNLEDNLLNGLTNVVVEYFESNGNQIVLTNPFVSNSQTITAVVKNNYGKNCDFTAEIKFVVDKLPQAFALPTYLTSVCDDELDPALQNGTYSFDTSTFQNSILGNQTNLVLHYFDQNNNMLPSPLPNPFISTTQNLNVEIINPLNASCTTTMTIPLKVLKTPKIKLIGDELVCNNSNFTKIINAGLLDNSSIINYTYQWFLNGIPILNQTNYSLEVSSEGIYTVQVANATNCISIRTITVTSSSIATINKVEITDFSQDNTIVILVSGLGNYIFSLDGQNYQESNNFANLSPGIYNVYVKDTNDCGITKQEISVLGVPNFFTPNNDGVNDYWNIKGVNQHLNSKTKVSIYDRYGKLIKQINPLKTGWDGTYNNQIMISDDYWYLIELENGKILKGHFSLKR
jgi:gliding motility-associated-like protein